MLQNFHEPILALDMAVVGSVSSEDEGMHLNIQDKEHENIDVYPLFDIAVSLCCRNRTFSVGSSSL